MEVKVEVVSKEIIKPASPTPCELRKLKLSFLDQLAPGCYIPIIYFYPSSQLQNSVVDHSQIGSQLKTSLSLVLTHFYPLAGTIVDGCSVDCDDEGVEYSQAHVSCTLSEMVDEPEKNLLLRLLPLQPTSADKPSSDSRKLNLAVQYNIFDCGGIAIAVSISHYLCDGNSATIFVRDWAASSRGVTDVVEPSFDAAGQFPPTELTGVILPEFNGINGKSKRFVFSRANIAALREEVAGSKEGDSLDKPPTRVEAISCFIWKHLMAILRSKQQSKKPILANQVVNFRGRMDPPLPEHSMGNLIWYAVASAPIENEQNYQFLLEHMRKAINGIDSETVKGLQNSENTLEWMKQMTHAWNSGGIDFCSFSSWCRFPVYETDCGWGKPSWVSSPIGFYKNMTVLMPTGGDGVEAWITFEEEVMASFERDPEVVAFTSSRQERCQSPLTTRLHLVRKLSIDPKSIPTHVDLASTCLPHHQKLTHVCINYIESDRLSIKFCT